MASGPMAAVFREEVATVLHGFEFAAAPVTFEPGGVKSIFHIVHRWRLLRALCAVFRYLLGKF